MKLRDDNFIYSIKSSQNDTYKYIKSLQNKKYRDRYGEFFVEGEKMVTEALDEGADIKRIVFSEDFNVDEFLLRQNKLRNSIEMISVSAKLFKDLSDTVSPQGVLAVISMKKDNINTILERKNFFLLILDRIQDPGNLGTIIRTMDAVGGDAVVLLKGCSDPYNPKTIRSTMGSIFRVPITEVEDYNNFFDYLRDNNTHIVTSHLDGDNLYSWQGSYEKTALVIGNEAQGVRGEIVDISSSMIKIPIYGGNESLNASVAAGILMYEIYGKNKKIKS